MTNREVLEYSRQIMLAKSEIDTSQQAAPDLDDQVRNKFEEDSVNRARFVDNTLIIGAASKEFRNVFGVDVPHYELSDDCYVAVDKNGDGKFYTSVDKDECKLNLDKNEVLTVKDFMNENEEVYQFLDSWELINAAKFDSNMTCKNTFSDNNGLPLGKQHFFIDSKADSESSPAHNPICPPGYDKWAGANIYQYICKVFDFDELNLYRLIGGPKLSTIPQEFTINADGSNKLEYNIDETGTITKNHFKYEYLDDNNRKTDTPIIEASKNSMPLPEGCKGIDEAPIKWYTYRVNDNVTKVPGGWKHELNMEGSPFANCDLSIAEFRLVEDNSSQREFNKGIAVLARNPAQNEPSPSSKGNGYFDIQYSINIIYRNNAEDGNFDLGDVVETSKQRQFLWWKWEKKKVNKKKYKIIFSPVKSLKAATKKNLARFIANMENDCLKYYDWLDKRGLNNIIPDQATSRTKMSELKTAAESCAKRPGQSGTWTFLINKLKSRVEYDVGTTVNFNDSTTYSGAAYIIGSSTYIDRWDSEWVPGWPKWLRRLFKFISTPHYQTYQRVQINSATLKKNFIHSRISKTLVSREEWLGPSTGDLTKTLLHANRMKTPAQLINLLTDSERTALTNAGIISSGRIKLSNGSYLNNNTYYEFIVEDSLETRPSYDPAGIARANALNSFLNKNDSLYFDAFTTLSDRINKRTGTLRKTCSLLESTNINYQMMEQRKHNLAHLYSYLNAYEITGFSNNIATIKLASFEPYTSAYSNLPRLSTVYIFGDNTVLNKKTNVFEQNWLRTTITDIIDKVKDAEYSYTPTNDSIPIADKTYYCYDENSGNYRVATAEEIEIGEGLYEKSQYPTSGPVFSVKLADKIPLSLKGKNPRLVKVY